jgi:hypothetical protein
VKPEPISLHTVCGLEELGHHSARGLGRQLLAEAQDRLDVAALGQDLPVRRLDDVVEAPR